MEKVLVIVAVYGALAFLVYAILSTFGRGLWDTFRYILLPLGALAAIGFWVLPAIPPIACAAILAGLVAGWVVKSSA